jgi:hypothetical protein
MVSVATVAIRFSPHYWGGASARWFLFRFPRLRFFVVVFFCLCFCRSVRLHLSCSGILRRLEKDLGKGFSRDSLYLTRTIQTLSLHHQESRTRKKPETGP